MIRGAVLVCSVTVVLACASTPPPTADGPINWAEVSDERVPVIVTQDPDGSQRVTKLWVVIVDGQGLIVTGNTRWFRNIQRDPNVVFRIGGSAYPLRAELVTDEALKERVDAAMREKYGWQAWLYQPFEPRDPNVMRLTPRK